MHNLVENILNENYVSAQEIFEEILGEILEQKLYEKKRMMQAEVFGGLSRKQIQDRKDAGWPQAHPYLTALAKMKELEGKYKSDIQPKDKKKKKIAEGMGDLSPKELQARGKARAKEFGAQFGATARAGKERAEREAVKRAAKQKRGSTAEPGKPYIAPPKVEPVKTGGAPKVELEPADIKKPEVDRSKSRVFAKHEIEKAEKAPARAKDTWQSDKDTAYALRRSGDTQAVGRFRKAYSGYRAKRELKGFGSAMGGFAKGIISGLQEDTE